MKMIFFDTETTGLRPGNICQLSYILVDTSDKPIKPIGKNIFFTVEYVEPSAEKIHGFSAEALYRLSSGQYFEDRFEEFLSDFQTADFLIGHNVSFDIKFLTYELEGCGEVLEPKNIFCTMNYYKDICNFRNGRNDCKFPKLQEVIEFLHIEESSIDSLSKKYFNETGNFHDARFDTTATYLLVTEGIRKGYIPKNYFSNKLANV
jgi:DNA polymerase III subunit epsilon